jgi:hypothetical protein
MASTPELSIPIPLYMLAQPEDYDEAKGALSISDLAHQLIFHSDDAVVMVFFSTREKALSFTEAQGLSGKIVRCSELRLLKVLVGYQPKWIAVDPTVTDTAPKMLSTRKFVEKVANQQGLKVNFVD